jgi:hypothetical protein
MNESDQIKNELQGSGFLDEVKQKRLPDSEMLTASALEKYENRFATLQPDVVHRNADKILQRLLQYERDIYTEREERVYREALVVFLDNKYDTGQVSLHSFAENEEEEKYTDYPKLQEMFAEIEDIYESANGFNEAFSKILPLLYPAMDAISVSAQQSRRKRAGSSLRNHIENLIEKAGYEIMETHGSGNGHIYTIKPVESQTTTRLYISFLTTLKDRFRQSLSGQSVRNSEMPQFIATGAGNNIFTGSSTSDVTKQKVEEITNEGFTLIVFENVKQERHTDENNVISYTDFFGSRLKSLTGE